MKTVRNKTRRPLRVPLPQGKVLFLGPNQTGQIGAHAEDHPPLQKLIAAGEIEIEGQGEAPVPTARREGGRESTQGHAHHETAFKTGDR